MIHSLICLVWHYIFISHTRTDILLLRSLLGSKHNVLQLVQLDHSAITQMVAAITKRLGTNFWLPFRTRVKLVRLSIILLTLISTTQHDLTTFQTVSRLIPQFSTFCSQITMIKRLGNWPEERGDKKCRNKTV